MKEAIAAKQGGLYTVPEVAELLHTDVHQIYKFINAQLLPVLKLGRYKIRPTSLETFLEKYEGYDLSDPANPIPLFKTKEAHPNEAVQVQHHRPV